MVRSKRRVIKMATVGIISEEPRDLHSEFYFRGQCLPEPPLFTSLLLFVGSTGGDYRLLEEGFPA